jgi:hypothetical protein
MAAPNSEIAKGITLRRHFYSSVPILTGKANATIAVGDILEDASGLLTLADHDDAASLVGVAKSAAVAGEWVNYIPLWTGLIWEMTLDEDTTTGTVLADTHRLQAYGLGIDAGNLKPYVNTSETTTIALVVVDFGAQIGLGAVGDTYARVEVSFLPNKTIWGA